MKLVDDQIVWTCESNLESTERICQPYKVKLKTNKYGTVSGHAFDQDTGEIYLAPNSTIIIDEDNIFQTRKEANDYYKHYIQSEICYLQLALESFLNSKTDGEE